MSSFEKLIRRSTVGVGIAAAMATSFALSAQAEVNLSGKTVEWTIPFSEKGGSAKWAHFFAPLLSEALPGQPTVVVKFMPGAGSTKGANWFQGQKHGDGTVLFGSSGSTQFPYLLGDPRVKYEYKDWNPVMATGTGGVAYLAPDLGAKFDGPANNLKGVTFIYGSQGATILHLSPRLASDLLGPSSVTRSRITGRGLRPRSVVRREPGRLLLTGMPCLTGSTLGGPRP